MGGLKISHLPSKLRFSAKCSFFGQSLSRGHYQLTYQPPEGVYLLNHFPGDILKRCKVSCWYSQAIWSRPRNEVLRRRSLFFAVWFTYHFDKRKEFIAYACTLFKFHKTLSICICISRQNELWLLKAKAKMRRIDLYWHFSLKFACCCSHFPCNLNY